jgi:hypothetical protein
MKGEFDMQHNHEHYHLPESHTRWWKSPTGIACLFFMVATGYFLFMEHRAHIVPYLPYLIILLCPLMHIFHHRGHGHHKKEED